MRRLTLFPFLLGAISLVSRARGAGEACSSSSKCPSSSPCCSQGGLCGGGALQCADSCQPLGSYSPTSCLPNPICTDKNITFSPSDYKNADMFRPILLYNGDSSKAPFTLDYGYLSQGPEGVMLQLTAPTQTKISTTDYMLYGSVELSARHDAIQGLVFAFITMSDIKDEIDWEFTTANGSEGFTNYFSQGVVGSGTSATVNGGSGFSTSDWHTYGINWQEDSLEWSIDGNVVQNVTRSAAGKNYPRSPSRIQISTWAGGNSTNTQGVIDWAGGPIDWSSPTYTDQGFYSAEIRSFSTKCASQNVNGVDQVGSGDNTTSWVYNGQNSSSLNGPQFTLNTDPISFLDDPSKDGMSGLPGYSTQSDYTASNNGAWDGSGHTSGLSKQEIGGSGGDSGGWLANNKTLSIVVPVAAAFVGLIAIWATVVFCIKKRNKSKEISYGSSKENGTSSVLAGIAPASSRKVSPYNRLQEDHDEEDVAPAGARRVGRGYGPAVGPAGLHRAEYVDSTSSLHDSTDHSAHSDVGYHMDERARSPAPSPYTGAGVRGPYTPAFNAYTPALNQTPALNHWSTPRQGYAAQNYASPAYTQTARPQQQHAAAFPTPRQQPARPHQSPYQPQPQYQYQPQPQYQQPYQQPFTQQNQQQYHQPQPHNQAYAQQPYHGQQHQAPRRGY